VQPRVVPPPLVRPLVNGLEYSEEKEDVGGEGEERKKKVNGGQHQDSRCVRTRPLLGRWSNQSDVQ
jgi:hypothetical protein